MSYSKRNYWCFFVLVAYLAKVLTACDRTPNIQYSASSSPLIEHTLRQLNQVNILIPEDAFKHYGPTSRSSVGFLPSRFATKIFACFVFHVHFFYCPLFARSFDRPNSICHKFQTTKLLIMQRFSISRYSLPLRSKCSSEHPVPKPP